MVFAPLPQASSAVSHTPSGTGPEPQRSPLSPSQLALLPRHEVGPEPTVLLLGCRCPAAAAETCAGNQLVRQTAEVGGDMDASLYDDRGVGPIINNTQTVLLQQTGRY